MNRCLLDTNVLSELSRANPHAGVVAFIEDTPGQECFISTVTFAEIRYGIRLINEPDRRERFEVWLKQMRTRFAESVFEVTEETMLIWRTLMAQGRKANITYSQPDLIFAATAIEHDVTLATRT